MIAPAVCQLICVSCFVRGPIILQQEIELISCHAQQILEPSPIMWGRTKDGHNNAASIGLK